MLSRYTVALPVRRKLTTYRVPREYCLIFDLRMGWYVASGTLNPYSRIENASHLGGPLRIGVATCP